MLGGAFIYAYSRPEGCKYFRDTDEHVGGSLDSDVNVISLCNSICIDSSWTHKRVTITWTGLVDEMLQDCRVQHRHRCDYKTERDSSNWAEFYVVILLLEWWVYETVHNGGEEKNCDWIEVLHEIVRNTVSIHLRSLRHEVSRKLRVGQPVSC
jgi:hypothetical protein